MEQNAVSQINKIFVHTYTFLMWDGLSGTTLIWDG